MGDLVTIYRDYYQGANDEPLADGKTAQILDNDWADRPLRSGSALFYVFLCNDVYRLLDHDAVAEKWLSETRGTWALLSQWKLCGDCHAAGIGATCKDHLHQLSTAFPPFRELKPAGDCDFCRLVYQLYPSLLQEKVAQKRQQTLHSANESMDITWQIAAIMSTLRSPTSMAVTLMFAPPDAEERVAENPDEESRIPFEAFSIYVSFEKLEEHIPPEPESALSPTVLDFLRKNLNDCFSGTRLSHAKCHQDEGLYKDWPSRVLRVTGEGAITLADFRPDMAGQYAALSYCWGSPEELRRHPPLRATSSTMQMLRHGIKLHQLPRTIEQAARICAHLGIQYLWVDALCIIQDDGLDWERESRKMATVYSEARVTIIAASSTSCHSGFLDMDMGGIVLDTQTPSAGSSARMIGRLASYRGFHTDEFAPLNHPVHDPIDNRGWTLQEQVLSTRYIRFTQNDVQWECRSHKACLCAQRPHSSPLVTTGTTQWTDIPGHFNYRKLTLTSDKLRALSGLAKASRRVEHGDLYLAGMWRNMLLDTKTYTGQLYWRTRAGESEPCYNTYIAPSFSWASVPSALTSESLVWGAPDSGSEPGLLQVAISVKSYLSRLLCKVLDAGTTPLSESDPLGPVTDGFLTLRAPLVGCEISSLDGKEFAVTSTSDLAFTVDPFFCRFDCLVTQVQLADGRLTVARSQHRQPFDATETTIALLRSVTADDEIGCPTVGVEGLILGRCSGRDGYQRLGYIQIKPPGDIDAIDWSKWLTEITIY